jgi:hypothetical protein
MHKPITTDRYNTRVTLFDSGLSKFDRLVWRAAIADFMRDTSRIENAANVPSDFSTMPTTGDWIHD